MGVFMGFFSMGASILLVPMVMFIQKRSDGPGTKGLLYGSVPWVAFWMLMCIGGIVT